MPEKDGENFGLCMYLCLYQDEVVANKKQCHLATTTCKVETVFDRWNYLGLLFCNLESKIYWFFPLSLMFIYFIFSFISAVVDEYIANGITHISKTLKLSESLAAVTLIALANGAGGCYHCYCSFK